MVEKLLQTKWEKFIRYRYICEFTLFVVHWVFFSAAVILRPGTDKRYRAAMKNYLNLTEIYESDNVTSNISLTRPTFNQCYLSQIQEPQEIARFIFELLTLTTTTFYLDEH